ncbi:MAG: nucleotide pyrophosphohydrolase [Candidatus Micrarchaeota archaeon]|nr:MAG: nucleotide pyrophosphohydrolase [Candidatus Micrarchaeota archaeon]
MSDRYTSVKTLKELVQRFCEERDWDQFNNAKDLAISITTEAAELLELFRFKTEKDIDAMLKDPVKREQIGEELADIFYSTLRFAQRFGFDLSDELRSKLRKNAKKYPIEKAKGSNKKYNEV